MFFKRKKHDCSKVLVKTFLALDGELSEEEEKRFLEDIKRCNHCLERYDIEKSVKSFLTSRIERKNVPENLISDIKKKIKRSVS